MSDSQLGGNERMPMRALQDQLHKLVQARRREAPLVELATAALERRIVQRTDGRYLVRTSQTHALVSTRESAEQMLAIDLRASWKQVHDALAVIEGNEPAMDCAS